MKKLKVNLNRKNNMRNDVFTKVFIAYASRGWWNIFRMSLYTILPVFLSILFVTFFVSFSSTSLMGVIFFISFISLTLTSIFSYASITRDLKESNILNKHIISKAKKMFIELVPILFFISFGLILFSINMLLIIIFLGLGPVDWLTLYLGVILTILMTLGISKFIAIHFESKISFVIARIIFLIFVCFLSGGSLFGTNTLLAIPFFKVFSYFNPLTYPFTILNISVSQAIPVNFLFANQASLESIVVGTNFWNFGDPLAIIVSDNNNITFIKTVFYHPFDKYIGLTLSLTLPFIFLYFSSNYLLTFNHLYHLNFIKKESFTKTLSKNQQEVKKILTFSKKETK